MGQAIGTAAAHAHRNTTDAHGSVTHAYAVQQTLLADGCFLPHVATHAGENPVSSATFSASSQATLHGIGTNDAWVSGGLGFHRPPSDTRGYELTRAYCQWLFLSGGQLDRIDLCCDATDTASITVSLRKVDSIWDYHRTTTPIATTTLAVAAGDDQWVRWDCALADLDAGCYRIDVDACPGVTWRLSSGMLPGMVGGHQLSEQKMRRAANAPLAFRLAPAQAVWDPQQVASGVARPHTASNAWRSDPGAGFPQQLTAEWEESHTFGSVQVIFAGHLLGEIHGTPPFFRDPQTVRDYHIDACVDGVDNHRHCTRQLSRPRSPSARRSSVCQRTPPGH